MLLSESSNSLSEEGTVALFWPFRTLLLVFVLSAWFHIPGQVSSSYCDPGLEGAPRPKFLELDYERTFQHGIRSAYSTDDRLTYSGDVRRIARWGATLRVPFYSDESFRASATLQYLSESMALQALSFEEEVNLIESVGGNTFHRMGATFYLQKSLRGNKYLTLRSKGALNYEDIANEDLFATAFRHSMALTLGIKKSAVHRMQFGVAYSYAFGRARIYPLFAYERNYPNDYRLRVFLPAFIELAKDLDSSNRIILRTELDGANYKVDISNLGFTAPYVLERSDVRCFLAYEREVHDWLWMRVLTGIDYNIGLTLVSDHRLQRGDVIAENDVDSAFFGQVSVFLVPPRKFWNKRQ